MTRGAAAQEITVNGVVLPSAWDDAGRLVEVAVFSQEDGELVVGPSGPGRKLLSLCHCRVAVRGRVVAQGGQRTIEVAGFKILGDASASGYDQVADGA